MVLALELSTLQVRALSCWTTRVMPKVKEAELIAVKVEEKGEGEGQ
jgi:hypothetical protein